MASYQLIKEAREDGTLDLQRKDCTLQVESCNGDVESALQKIYPSSPPPRSGSDNGANGASRGATSPSGRLVSLDVFRGLTVVLMILVDDAGGILPAINHSPWNGLTLADVVMPFFLFMVGVSLALVYKNMSSRAAASKKAIFRALKLFNFRGFSPRCTSEIYLLCGYFHGINNLTYGVDMDLIRWMGILQIPIGAPSEEAKIFTVKCGVHGDTGPACNAAGMIDRMILGVQHLYRRPIYAEQK
ncbi:UNVERIFIED_CONTAM: Heparan-alpha-glucosaminide N-acetyltransferase [Sesamum angustifolium]|uniref:Heparan-alpha-glucosaminide N-acetyltransferase n=1 Tax=Sesamum angustifolium TaxID=2727405 RepID=A0AAW2Q7T8_9LAMI